MHKCIVCGNVSCNTRVNRPEVLYHGFPKNQYMKRKWLKVIRIDRGHDGPKICSDHFLPEQYRPGKRRFLSYGAVPQPYDQNGYPTNFATQNNVVLPIQQNNIREEPIENNFESPGRSSRLTRNNEDMSDHTIGSGLRCSVKNCFNRHSENLSFFGYPKDFTLRKKWIEKCGIQRDPAKIVKPGTRVCSTHFEPGCFRNTQLKNRLKPGAVPSLFLDNAPDVLPVSINEMPVLITHEDQIISPIDNGAAEQSEEEYQNYWLVDTDNISMITDLTIDDSSNSS
ncbi:unnamed protein product [Macrosiphum euphorbiae]|uniref:THAP-type domain-containing protein n=1 Tax=Macrosiphum euphorbiae TaxID=13131 RepID=A0AAV0W061_9HEMI|nr:unnamed protein product [Macrosiphum euphorbiae]